MTKLLWDQVGSRRFETGCDRGILYLPDGKAVPWNGLLSVEDDSNVSVEPYYLDGIKYLDRRINGDYSGTLKAYTYPDEFAQFDGIGEFDPGVLVTGQSSNETFGLSYRTKLGNDVDGLDFGYRLHVLYNLTAKPDSKSYSSVSSAVAPEEFSWSLTGIPTPMVGFKPTVHIILDSTRLYPGAMFTFENYLYGTDTADPYLPNPAEFIIVHNDLISNPLELFI